MHCSTTKLFYLLVLLILCGCAGSPKKDLFFRIRPPTTEVPYIHQDSKIGFRAQLESQRITLNPTRNLVTHFDFSNETLTQTSDNSGKAINLAGVDLSLFYTREVFRRPFEFSASADFFKIKAQLLDFRSSDKGFYFNANASYAITAVYEATSSCDLICFDSTNSAKNKEAESGILASGSGREYKLGTTLGYSFNTSHHVFVGYNSLKVDLTMAASRSTGTPLEINSQEEAHGYGFGGGYFYKFDSVDTYLALTLDQSKIYWRSSAITSNILGLQMSASFN